MDGLIIAFPSSYTLLTQSYACRDALEQIRSRFGADLDFSESFIDRLTIVLSQHSMVVAFDRWNGILVLFRCDEGRTLCFDVGYFYVWLLALGCR